MASDEMLRLLEDEKDRLSAETLALSDDDLAEAFAGAKAMPGVVHYIGTTYVTGSSDAPVKRTEQLAWSRGRVNDSLERFQGGLNRERSRHRCESDGDHDRDGASAALS